MPLPPTVARWSRRRRPGLTGAVGELLGTSVGVAIPLQRHHPALVLGASLAELVALMVLVLTGQLAAFAGLVVLATALVALAATNSHRVLAITSSGVLVLVASAKGRPLASIGPAPAQLSLPPPAGLAVAVELDGRTWWVDRPAFPRLALARDLLPTSGAPDGTATASEWRE